MKRKFGLIGYGYWGQKVYQTLKQITDEKNILIVDPYYKGSSSELQIVSLEDLLNNPTVSHVLIVTPEETHFDLALKCLIAGKNVFVEKPLCLKSIEAQQLIKIAEEKNLILYVDYTFLFDPYVKKIKTLIENNKIGKLVHIESYRHSININKPKVTVFDDLATHDLYLGRHFFSANPLKLEKITQQINSAQINQAQVLYTFSQGTMLGNYSWMQPTAQRKMVFFGETHTLVWDRAFEEIYLYQKHSLIEKIPVLSKTSPLSTSLKKFLSGVKRSGYLSDVKNLENLDQTKAQ